MYTKYYIEKSILAASLLHVVYIYIRNFQEELAYKIKYDINFKDLWLKLKNEQLNFVHIDKIRAGCIYIYIYISN